MFCLWFGPETSFDMKVITAEGGPYMHATQHNPTSESTTDAGCQSNHTLKRICTLSAKTSY